MPSSFSRSYDFWRGHYDWLDPAPSELDPEIHEFCARYRDASMAERERLTAALVALDSYTLQTFAQRCAILGLRSGNVRRIEDGLVAAGAIHLEAMDSRDASGPLALSVYCLHRACVDAAQAVRNAARRIPGRMSTILDGPLLSRWESRSSIEEWQRSERFAEVTTDAGIGFIGWDSIEYAPRADLVGIALDFLPSLRADPGYQFDEVTLAGSLPSYWLTGESNHARLWLEHGVTGVCNVTATRRPKAVEGPATPRTELGQRLWLSIVETGDPDAAARLERLANEPARGRHALRGFRRANLCAVLVAFAITTEDSDESAESLERFREPLLAALSKFG